MSQETKIAAQLYTIREFMKTPADMAVSLNKISDIGYKAVQLSGHGEIETSELKKLVDDAGLTVCATHIGFDSIQNDLDKVVEDHNTLECKNIAIGMMPREYMNGGEEGYRTFAGLADEAGAKLREKGFVFGYHNHSNELVRFGKKTGMDILIENTRPENMIMEIDTYWIQHGGGDPAAWIRKCAGRASYVHFKDMVIIMDDGRKQQFAEIGEGNLNWPEILKACDEAGSEWYIVEQDTSLIDPFDSLKISLENMKAMGIQ